MMETSLAVLISTAAFIALTHTLVGIDHYLPFIVLGRARQWSVKKAWMWTGICGIGHVLSSVVIGALGIALGWAVGGMEAFEGVRGELAGYALMGFGLLYFVWGLWKATKGHAHTHVHADGTVHRHVHFHKMGAADDDHERQPHEDPAHVTTHQKSVWAVFIIFVLGPCEPLIPLLMVPAAQHSAASVALVAAVFGLITIGTMLVMVTLGLSGLKLIKLKRTERYLHASAGFAILVSGALINFAGI